MKRIIALSTILGVLGYPNFYLRYEPLPEYNPPVPVIVEVEIIEDEEPKDPIEESVLKYSEEYDVDPELIYAMMEIESNRRPHARSHKGAYGLMQLMPDTAKWLGVNHKTIDGNIEGGVKYISMQIKRYGKVKIALAAYNAGPGNVDKYGGTIPPFQETRNYVRKICDIYSYCG